MNRTIDVAEMIAKLEKLINPQNEMKSIAVKSNKK